MKRRKIRPWRKEQENCIRSICQVLTDNEDYETAIPWLLKLQEIDGVTVENSLQLSEAYSMMDDYENAVAVLQKADQNDESIKKCSAGGENFLRAVLL